MDIVRVIGSHGEALSSTVHGQIHVLRRPVTVIQKVDRRAGVAAGRPERGVVQCGGDVQA